MIGKLTWPKPLAAAPSLVRRPVVLAGIAILVLGAAATGAWLTQPPETAPPAAPAAAPAAPVVLQDPPPPPEPTSADIVRSEPPPAASTPAPSTPAPSTPAASTPAPSTPAAEPIKPADWAAMPIDELRTRANANEIPAMEELARRLVQGVGVTKDQQAGAGWLLRAANHGSTQSAFNVAVMYERGFVVERDSTKAIEWYRKAVAANVAMAKHNLALLLRDGKGAPRDGKEAVELLRSAARQGMSASMFTLGDIFERGDAAPKDAPTAMAWFAITAEFERQTHRGTETVLAKTATQRTQTLQRILTPAELERAQQLGQSEFKQIVEALSPPKPPPAAAPPAETAVAPAPPAADVDPPGWPTAAIDQVRVIQQALVDLKFLRDKPDGAIGPLTRAAIRAFQRSIAMRETGEPTRDVYAALRDSLASRDVVANSPLPLPAKVEAPKPEIPTVELPKIELPKVDIAKGEPSKPEPAKVDPPKPALPKIETAKPVTAPVTAAAEPPKAPAVIDIGRPEPAPPPPTSADIAGTTAKEVAKSETPKPDPDTWPTAPVDQVTAVQKLLRDLNFSRDAPDGINGPGTRAAIRDYERAAGLNVTGEPSKVLFESLKELRLLMGPKAN
jgi:peptidoglycan hydrolase-like protein with peptidoglycan-binding domain